MILFAIQNQIYCFTNTLCMTGTDWKKRVEKRAVDSSKIITNKLIKLIYIHFHSLTSFSLSLNSSYSVSKESGLEQLFSYREYII